MEKWTDLTTMQLKNHTYNKLDAKMTRGYAILSMCILHLFCRTGTEVLGTPLLWITAEKPLVYFFGFFSEICVPTYTLCAGYAQTLLNEKRVLNIKTNASRIKKLLINYWIILVLFSIVGITIGKVEVIPQSVPAFLKSIVLLHSYNGAWWFLNTYVILLCCYKILQLPVKRINPCLGIILSFGIAFVWYFIGHFNLVQMSSDNAVLNFLLKEINNLLDVLPYYWIGGFVCRLKLISRISEWLNVHIIHQNALLLIILTVVFVLANAMHKSVFMGICAVITFLIFNLLNKPFWIDKAFLFLGKHSTNIWLSHMFFYAYTFPGLVQSAKLPLLMLAFLLLLSTCTSYIEKGVEKILRLTSDT